MKTNKINAVDKLSRLKNKALRYIQPNDAKQIWISTCLFFLLGLATPTVYAQSYGLDQPAPVAAFLNNSLPRLTPMSADSSGWDVVNAFPNITLQNTLTIVPNPADNRLYVGSREGVIHSFENDEQTSATDLFMDLSDRVAVAIDSGLLGLVFHPQFGLAGSPYQNHFYAYYSAYCPTNALGTAVDFANCNHAYPRDPVSGFADTWLRLSRFTAYRDPATGLWRGDAESEQPMLNIRAYNSAHRGGGLTFADDGMLYLTIGDQERYYTAQDIQDTLEGGVLRLAVDVVENGNNSWLCPSGSHLPRRVFQTVSTNNDEMSGRLYCIPNNNPWLDANGSVFEEYYAIGLRSPHRLAFDSLSGTLWLGDVGLITAEEINIIQSGHNYGWPFREGRVAGPRGQPEFIRGTVSEPLVDFPREEAAAIIGGYVYRGTRFPELQGRYITGDYVSRSLWAITLDSNSMTAEKSLLTSFRPGALSTFGQDNQGEIFMGSVAANVPLHRLERVGDAPPEPPALLSQTAAFVDVSDFILNPAAVPYDLVSFWSDGALKSRWIFLPNDGTHDQLDEKILFSETENWDFPSGTVLMKHFELALEEGNPASAVRLETRFLVLDERGQWYGLTYRWRPDYSDADLLSTAETAEFTIQTSDGGSRQQSWLFPSRDSCLTCHTAGAGGALGPRTHQLNRDYTYAHTGRRDNQLRTWNALGMFSPALDEAAIANFPAGARLDDVTASLELRARSWLDANCSNCHRPETGNRAAFDARLTTDLANQGLIWGGVNNNLGINGAFLIHPGDSDRSIIYQRALRTGIGAMPPLAKSLADQTGMRILQEWIQRIDPGYPLAGLLFEYYEVLNLTQLPDFDSLLPKRTGSVPDFDISNRDQDNNFAFRFSGVIDVPTEGLWTFYTTSDDGSQLFINDQLVVDNDGLHAAREVAGSVYLSQGFHSIRVGMFDLGGSELLDVSWQGPGTAKQTIPGAQLYRWTPNWAVNSAPILDSPGDQISQPGDSVSLSLSASDSDDDVLFFDISGLPEGLQLDAQSGEISGLIAAHSIGSYAVSASVSDASEISVVNFIWQVGAQPGNNLPSIVRPEDQSHVVGQRIDLPVSASDADGDTLTFSANGLPPALVIDAQSGLISGTLPTNSAGHYQVTIEVHDGQSSAQAVFSWQVSSPTLALLNTDIGPVGLAGSTAISSENGNHITLSASGHDIWGVSDGFHFAYQQLTGNGEISVRLASVSNTNAWAKAGVMMRTSLTANSAHAMMALTPRNGSTFQRRRESDQGSFHTAGPHIAAPAWVRLVRSGNLLSAYVSTQGTDWTLVANESMAMPQTLYVGLALTSHNNEALATAVFEQLSIKQLETDTLAPSAPSSLSVSASSNSSITLNWAASTASDLAGYRIYRDGSSSAIASTTGTHYVDSGLNANTAYLYEVSAFDISGNESSRSQASSATTLITNPWLGSDIGIVGPTGFYSAAAGVVSVHGSGTDIWGNNDGFHFVSQHLNGDGEIIARILSQSDSHPWAKAGVMIRATLNANSPHAMMLVTPSNGGAFQRRQSVGSYTAHTPVSEMSTPSWVRLVRSGTLFTAYLSDDGISWTAAGSDSISMPANVHIGLAISSHNNAVLGSAQFESVAIHVPSAAPSVSE